MSERRDGPTHVMITGASSGIGRALALRYAAPGRILSLVGRDAARLDAIAAAGRAQGAVIEAARIDVTDHTTLEPWIEARDAARPVDLVIAGAGLGGARALAPLGGERGAQARDLMSVNTLGVFNTLTPLQPRMMRRGAGHVVIIGSIQGGVGLPQAPVYSASKAAVRIYADGMRRLLRPHGVRVTLVLPGFVDTPMSQSLTAPRPWLWTAERAADRILRDVARGARVSAFPWPLRLAVALGAWAPDALVDRVLTHSLRHTGLAPDPGASDDP
ncbi:MAG: SDR family NAD(P)-dependent oxidoreductase [Pararhodobacter sp.]|nr:SDR family NAD(P)-dependent oxidoreductase [Pararhodobacter sp.]